MDLLILLSFFVLTTMASATFLLYGYLGLKRIYFGSQNLADDVEEEITEEILQPSKLHEATLKRMESHKVILDRLWKNRKSILEIVPLLSLPAPKQVNDNQQDSEEIENNVIILADRSIPKVSDPRKVNTTISKTVNKVATLEFEKSFPEFRNDVADAASGRWISIFKTYLSVDITKWEQRRNIVCPVCDRDDKYYLIDQNTGATHCASAGCNHHAHDGFATIATFTGEKYGKIVSKLAEEFGLRSKTNSKIRQRKTYKKTPEVKKEMTEGQQKQLDYILENSSKVQSTNHAYQYLLNRGIPKDVLERTKDSLYQIDKLSYFDEDGNKGYYPALLLPIIKNELLIGVHRIYLDKSGNRLPLKEAKKPTSNYPGAYSGARIELGVINDGIYSIAEGVETALAVTALFGDICWSTMNSAGIQSFNPPKDTKKVNIYADLDLSKGGEVAAMKLVTRLNDIGIASEIKMPPESLWNKSKSPKGIDWLDVLVSQNHQEIVELS